MGIRTLGRRTLQGRHREQHEQRLRGWRLGCLGNGREQVAMLPGRFWGEDGGERESNERIWGASPLTLGLPLPARLRSLP